MTSEPRQGSDAMKHDIDVTADLTAQDGDGLGWSTLAAARDPSHVRPGGAMPRRQLLRLGRTVACTVSSSVHPTAGLLPDLLPCGAG